MKSKRLKEILAFYVALMTSINYDAETGNRMSRDLFPKKFFDGMDEVFKTDVLSTVSGKEDALGSLDALQEKYKDE